MMFLGETICGVLFYIYTKYNERAKKKNQSVKEILLFNNELHLTKINPIVFAIPAFLDSLGGACLFTGLAWVAASVY